MWILFSAAHCKLFLTPHIFLPKQVFHTLLQQAELAGVFSFPVSSPLAYKDWIYKSPSQKHENGDYFLNWNV